MGKIMRESKKIVEDILIGLKTFGEITDIWFFCFIIFQGVI